MFSSFLLGLLYCKPGSRSLGHVVGVSIDLLKVSLDMLKFGLAMSGLDFFLAIHHMIRPTGIPRGTTNCVTTNCDDIRHFDRDLMNCEDHFQDEFNACKC